MAHVEPVKAKEMPSANPIAWRSVIPRGFITHVLAGLIALTSRNQSYYDTFDAPLGFALSVYQRFRRRDDLFLTHADETEDLGCRFGGFGNAVDRQTVDTDLALLGRGLCQFRV